MTDYWQDKVYSEEKNASIVGQTPRVAVWKKNKTTLWYYPTPKKKCKTPLFLIYSLVSKPYLLDLAPGSSMIEAFHQKGFDVYLLDFGVPGYEDYDISLDTYIYGHIQKAVKRTLHHSQSSDVSIVGYCLGGTLSIIYAAIATEPIKNLILFAPPVDFSQIPLLEKWREFLRENEMKIDDLLSLYGVVPPSIVNLGMRTITSPISITPHIGLIERGHDKNYVEKWKKFNRWAKDHIPFVGKTLYELLYDVVLENKLIQNQLKINEQQVLLSNIKANLLVVSTSGDQIVKEEYVISLLDKVSSEDITYKRVKGGHASLAIKGELPLFLEEWLVQRST
ncbi:alpha/beta fold hydrolase [Alkalihalobacterium bogoriense]|uniref:alpha/beta fold hydrolase n=1 Tax=Alkalihalobacterium bogoriense TaxID=246272 RepID=UPI000687B25C|nr:alpha/beta fold hydrolase [Alkalihalobacterium bogoriense]